MNSFEIVAPRVEMYLKELLKMLVGERLPLHRVSARTRVFVNAR